MQELYPFGDASDGNKVDAARTKVDMEKITRVIEDHFKNTWLLARAVLVIKDGNIIYEKYGDGATADRPQLGWSMTKSWLHTLVGIAIFKGILPDGLQTKMKIPEWNNDTRKYKYLT